MIRWVVATRETIARYLVSRRHVQRGNELDVGRVKNVVDAHAPFAVGDVLERGKLWLGCHWTASAHGARKVGLGIL
jgi:hypothetical protein